MYLFITDALVHDSKDFLVEDEAPTTNLRSYHFIIANLGGHRKA